MNKANKPQYIFVSYSLPGDGVFSTGILYYCCWIMIVPFNSLEMIVIIIITYHSFFPRPQAGWLDRSRLIWAVHALTYTGKLIWNNLNILSIKNDYFFYTSNRTKWAIAFVTTVNAVINAIAHLVLFDVLTKKAVTLQWRELLENNTACLLKHSHGL